MDPSEKPKAINLDCSTRAKVVIRTKLSTSKQPIRPTVSIFSRNFKQPNSLKPSVTLVETPVQGLMQVPLPQPTNNAPQNSPRPSLLAPKMNAKSKTIEDSKIKKQQPTTSPHHSPTTVASPKGKIIPLPSRLRISSASSSVTPTPEPEPVKLTALPILPIPTPSRPSQYGEEYDKCPCAKGRARGRPPCDRCQLMLLADRLCELIDVQCQKWGIPAKN